MIQVEHLHKSFGGREVLQDITIDFHQGEINLIIGKSGSGKTVLLKTILGLYPPESGKILFNEEDILQFSKQKLKRLRRQIGMVFQGSALFDSQTIVDNVQFPLEVFSRQEKQERRKRAEQCLERVEIDTSAFSLYPAEISGGMQKRVAIARAIALSPTFLFCDEPTSGLDPQTAGVIDELLKQLTIEEQMTTIINTHDMNTVGNIGDHLTHIHEGKIGWQGKCEKIHTEGNKTLHDFIYSSSPLRRAKR